MNYTNATPGAETRGALIAAGRDLFATKGFDGASVRAITNRAGANLGAITYHFGSKRALYEAVLDAGLRPLADRVAAAGGSAGTAQDRMVGIVEAYFEHLRNHPDLPRLLLQEMAAGKEPPAVVVETLHRVMGTLVRLQAEGVEDGTVRGGNPMLTALSVVAQPIYLTLVAPLLKNVGGVDLQDPRTRRAAVRHVTRFVRAGLSPDHPDPREAEEHP
ncbi:MAG: TetR/AcrR family transcriptional regulator [Gemmatimonadota bacterium]